VLQGLTDQPERQCGLGHISLADAGAEPAARQGHSVLKHRRLAEPSRPDHE
jgi:hypothetical protein